MQRERAKRGDDESYCFVDKNLTTIYLVGEITHTLASNFRRHLRQLEGSKRGATITVEINSPGGDIEAGLMIVDSICLSKKAVTTRVTGIAMSMGSLILAAGTTAEALPNSTIMVHQGSYRFNSPHDELETELAECKRLEKVCNELLDDLTDHDKGYWATRCAGKNLYLDAKQALQEGLITSIVGQT